MDHFPHLGLEAAGRDACAHKEETGLLLGVHTHQVAPLPVAGVLRL